MEKYELSTTWLNKNAGKIKTAYSLALENKYNVSSVKDVFEILKEIDPSNATEENAKVFSKILQLFAQRMKKNFELQPKEKPKTIH